MSLTARERNNPPSRRKSCAACIKAKRRCDAAVPACLRCSQRGIPCELPARRPQSGGTSKPSASAAPNGVAAAGHVPRPGTQDFVTLLMDSWSSADDALLGSAAFYPSPEAGISSCMSQPEGLGFASLEDMPTTNNVESSTNSSDTTLPGTAGNLFLHDLNEEPTNESPQIIHHASTVAPPTTRMFETPPDFIQQKLGYAIDEIKKVPAMMVRETQTPWCHPHLYELEMPRSMQDAHAACALYMAKNRTNSQVILRSIDCRVNDLLASPNPPGLFQILARTQALILYHIIRIFDGDIAARAAAERTQSALEDSAMDLLMHVDFNCPSPQKEPATAATAEASAAVAAGQLPMCPLGPTRQFWRDWIVQESGRRTLLFTFFFLQAYRVISGQPVGGCDGRLGLCHSFTMSASLWHAESPMAFARAWYQGRHLVVENTDFSAVLSQAKAEDVDAYGRIILTSLIGRDEAEVWFAARGGSLWAGGKAAATHTA